MSMDAEQFRDLVAGCSEQRLADYLQVDLKTFRRYKRGTSKIPHAATIALRLYLDGDLSAVGGKDWEHFYFGRDGRFYMPGWKYGWEPGELRALFFTKQLAAHWEREAKKLERELVGLRAAAWAAQKVRESVRPSSLSGHGIGRSSGGA